MIWTALALIGLVALGMWGLIFAIMVAERRAGCYIHGKGPCRVRTGWCPTPRS